MRHPKTQPAPITRIVNIHQTRLREITTLLAAEYPILVSQGIDSFATVHDRLITRACLEAYLDASPPEVIARVIKKAKAEYGKGRWVTEVDVRKYLMKWMGDTLRSQVFNSQEEHWRVYLRHKLEYIISATDSSASSRCPQGSWSKQRMAWKVQLASRSRDNREPPYPQPFIRHLRVQHNGLARLPARYLRGRTAKWARKKHLMEKRAVEGFSSPLRMEVELDMEAAEDEGCERAQQAEKSGTGEPAENQANDSTSKLPVPPNRDTLNILHSIASSTGSDRMVRDSEVKDLPTVKRAATSCNSIYWNWGQRWLREGAGTGSELGRELLSLGRLGECV